MAIPWIVIPQPKPSPVFRLICLPPPGGGIATFRGWSERLRAAEVGIVELPGRGTRVSEPPVASPSSAADAIARAVTDLRPLPLVLFGHGLGALLAFEAARRLGSAGWPLLALFVSGQRAPSLANPLPPVASLSPDDFVAHVRARFDAVPEPAAVDPDFLRAILPALRADMTMLETYRYEPAEPLPIPIVACGGVADPCAGRPELDGWRGETSSRFSVHQFDGGHQYLRYEGMAVTQLIANKLTVILSAASRPAAGRW